MSPKPTYLASRASPSPLAHTVDGEAAPFDAKASGPSFAPCLAWAPCLQGKQPEAPLHTTTPADVLRTELHPEQSLGHRCFHSVFLDQLLGNIRDCLSSVLL